MVIVFIYFFLGFIFSSLFYIFQDKIKEFMNENNGLEESPEESLFLGFGWPILIPAIFIICLFDKWVNFLKKLKKGIDK